LGYIPKDFDLAEPAKPVARMAGPYSYCLKTGAARACGRSDMGGVRKPKAAMEYGKFDMRGVRKPVTPMECGKSDMRGVRKPATAMEYGKSDMRGVWKPVTPILSALTEACPAAARSRIAATANNFTTEYLRVFIFYSFGI
jgi:hypothetical protein